MKRKLAAMTALPLSVSLLFTGFSAPAFASETVSYPEEQVIENIHTPNVANCASVITQENNNSLFELETENQTSNVKNPKLSYLFPSQEDISFYGTDDLETIALLKEMEKGFEFYGNEGAYDDLVIPAIQTRSWGTFANCVGNGLAKSFGLDVLKRAFNQEVRKALKSRQWKVASSVMHRNLKKFLGKKVASYVIKLIASKALPGGLPGQIAFQAGKCAIKEVW